MGDGTTTGPGPAAGPARVFIIHGRDLAARDELVKFVRSLGLEWLSFHDASLKVGASAFITDIIREGIAHATATLVLFTPDEQAALHNPQGRFMASEEQSARWQARPNVIFEAGLAFGIAGDRTVLVTLGADVRLFSNVGGKRTIELNNAGGKIQLRQQLEELVGKLEAAPDWASPEVSGNFDACVRRRWPYHDELGLLEAELNEICVGKAEVSILEILQSIVKSHPERDWSVSSPRRLMRLIAARYADDTVTEDAYWWMVVVGVLRYDEIGVWWRGNDPDWKASVDFAIFSRRGLALLERLKRLVAVPDMDCAAEAAG